MQLTGAAEEPKDKPQRTPAVEGLGEANAAGEGPLERMWGTETGAATEPGNGRRPLASAEERGESAGEGHGKGGARAWARDGGRDRAVFLQ